MTHALRRARAAAAPVVLAAAAAFGAALAPAAVRAAGPEIVAKAGLARWGEPLDTRAGFDKASRAALLAAVPVLDALARRPADELRAQLKIKGFDRESVRRWHERALAQALTDYRFAAAGCTADDWTCIAPPATTAGLVEAAAAWNAALPEAHRAWRDPFADFARAWAAEQLRLAALFPQVTSEIDRFDDDAEWTGDALPDRSFLLSFDDGPTAPGGTTDRTLRMLDAAGRHAAFFLLGGNLQARAATSPPGALAALYRGQCVGGHGWEHQSHQRWPQWQDSVVRTQALLAATFPPGQAMPWFRPPFGQRRPDSGAFFRAQGLQVALWNIDSQDWNAHVDADDVVERIVALMLIRRHGVLLFHDVHPKAQAALPEIFARLGGAVDWRDCRQPMR